MPIRVEGAPVQQEKERRASVLRVKLRFRREEKAAVELVRDYVEAKDKMEGFVRVAFQLGLK